MKTKLLFIALIVFAIGGLLFISPVKAATDSVSDINQEAKEMAGLDQEVSAEDLGVKAEPLLLPDSRFYPLKNFWRKARMAFTFNSIKKVELQQKFANEKLIEVKKVYEKNKDPEQAEKLLEKYSKEVGLTAERIEKIKKNPKNQAGINNLLDNLADHLIKREKVVQGLKEKLEKQLPSQAYEKVEANLNRTVERLGVKIEKLEGNRELLKERFVKIAERQEGSEFKNFKNLEILKNIEEKMPSEMSEAIKEAREKINEKFIQDMNKMNVEKRVRFKNYINEINGNAIRHLEIIKEMESGKILPELKIELEKAKDGSIQKIEDRIKRLNNQAEIDKLREQIQKSGKIREEIESRIPDFNRKIIEKKEIIEEQYSEKVCKDLCGDGVCQEIVCMAIGCPCAETAESCPEDCKEEEQTCNGKCKSLNYISGICRKFAISPEGMANKCRSNEISISGTSDCKLSTNAQGQHIVGVGITCCCQKGNLRVEPRINTR